MKTIPRDILTSPPLEKSENATKTQYQHSCNITVTFANITNLFGILFQTDGQSFKKFVYAEGADDQEPAENGSRTGRRLLLGLFEGWLFDGRYLDGGRARIVVGYPAGRRCLGHLFILLVTGIVLTDATGIFSLLLFVVLDTVVVANAVTAAVVMFAMRVTVTTREPVHQFFDRVHEEKPDAHDELSEQTG